MAQTHLSALTPPAVAIPLSLPERIFAIWAFVAAGSVAAGWAFSAVQQLPWAGGFCALLWFAGFLAVGRSWRESAEAERREIVRALAFWPFLVLAGLIFVASLIYLPVTHDSLSYRIPRLHLWLQQGYAGYVPTSDDRINYMTANWEFITLPFLQVAGARMLEAAALVSWVLLYLLGGLWARRAGASDRAALWLGLLPALAVFAVLQARSTSNDLVAAVFVFLSAWFAQAFHSGPSSSRLILSGLFLALAAGTKPHYLVLALPWLIWFFAARPFPGRFVPWRHLAWIVPLALLSSPLPTFVLNQMEVGSWKGAVEEGSFIGGNPFFNAVFGSIAFVWQSFQPPVNPLAGAWNAAVNQAGAVLAVKELVPRFNLGVHFAAIVDSASLGIAVAFAIVLGIWRSFRAPAASGFRWIALAGLAGFLLAVSQAVPGSIGRSFCGFAFLLFPLALAGLAGLRPRAVAAVSGFAWLVALTALILSAGRPLWPAAMVRQMLEERGLLGNRLGAMITSYTAFRERAIAGRVLYEHLGAGRRILVISGGGDPLAPIWEFARPREVLLTPPRATLEWVRGQQPDYVVVTGTGPEMHAELIEELARETEEIRREDYLVRLQRGPETWRLFRGPGNL